MINYMQRFRVGKRMLGAFGLLIALMITISLSALSSFNTLDQEFDAAAIEGNSRIRYASEVLTENGALMNAMQAMIITQSPERLAGFNNDFSAARDRYTQSYERLSAMPSDEATKRLLSEVTQTRVASAPHNSEVIELALAWQKEAAMQVMRERAMPSLVKNKEAVQAVLDHEHAKMAALIAQGEITISRARSTVIGIMLISLLVGLAMSWLVTRSLTLPLTRAAAAARELAAGRLDGAQLSGGADEAGDVLRAVQETRNSLTTLINGIQEMGRRHDAGEVSFRMDASMLDGEYHTIAALLDAQLSEHIGAALAAGRLAARYAIGDLSEDFPRLPGEKAQVSEAMDMVKSGIQSISNEILQLSQAAVHGDFTVRGDEARFQFGYRDMVSNLNTLMETADGSLNALSRVLKSIAAGDLTVRMEGNYEGVFAHMRDDANATVANLTDIVGRIQNTTGHINTAASEIASGNTDLSRRTEQQAANLEETAASMEELTSTVRQNAESARQANQLAIGAADVAAAGGDVVNQVVTTMGQIQESSRRIADIISVIDGIAFQTNILALNAAVEAARAGEQGRGFAVVASEVRTLAQRSAAAAKEIKDLIDNSVDKVTAGSALVNKAGQTMGEIVTSVQRVTGIMAEISAASQEQTAGIEQVNTTIVQMDETTQQNAALVEEASAAARAMEEQASQLAEAVSVFRLTGGKEVSVAFSTTQSSSRAVAVTPGTVARAAKPAAKTTATRNMPAPAEIDGAEWQSF